MGSLLRKRRRDRAHIEVIRSFGETSSSFDSAKYGQPTMLHIKLLKSLIPDIISEECKSGDKVQEGRETAK